MLQEGKIEDALEVYSIWPLQIILGNKGELSMERRNGKLDTFLTPKAKTASFLSKRPLVGYLLLGRSTKTKNVDY